MWKCYFIDIIFRMYTAFVVYDNTIFCLKIGNSSFIDIDKQCDITSFFVLKYI